MLMVQSNWRPIQVKPDADDSDESVPFSCHTIDVGQLCCVALPLVSHKVSVGMRTGSSEFSEYRSGRRSEALCAQVLLKTEYYRGC